MFAVAVLTPSTGLCRLSYAQSLAHLVAYFAQVRVFEECDTQYLTTDGIEGSGIGSNYDIMVEKYLKDKKWTHILCVEDDMGFDPDCLHILARRCLPFIGANYSVNKGHPLRFTARKDGENVVTSEESTGVEEVDFIPQGFTLIAREVLEAVPKPRFLNGYSPKSGNYVSQDYYFSQQAAQMGFKPYVDHDVSKKIYHVGSYNYSYRDVKEK